MFLKVFYPVYLVFFCESFDSNYYLQLLDKKPQTI